MEESLISLLLGSTAVAQIVGSRVFVGRRPQNAGLPAVVMYRISGAPEYADDGEVGLASLLFQLDCWADTYSEAKLLARAVTGVLSAFEGTVDGVDIRFITLERESDDPDTGTRDMVSNPFRTSLDFEVWERT